MTQMDKWFTAALVALAVLAIYAVATHAATQERFWWRQAVTDTLFNTNSVTTGTFDIGGCDGVRLFWAGEGSDSVTVAAQGSVDLTNWFTVTLPAAATLADLSTYAVDESVYVSTPARWLRFTITCNGDSASTTLDPDTLINVTVGATCPNYW